MAQWHVPLLAEFTPESCSSFPSATRKLASSPVGLPLKLSTSHAANRYFRSGEKHIQSTVSTFAATPASVSSPAAQSNARIPSGVPEATNTPCLLDAEKPVVATARVTAEVDTRNSRRFIFRMASAIVADGTCSAPLRSKTK